MTRLNLRKAISRFLLLKVKLAVLFLCLFQTTFAEILDPKENHLLLRKISEALDKAGIDVIQNYKSGVETKGKPVLAPLANFPIENWKISNWQQELDKEIFKAILAVPDNSPGGSFHTKWDKSINERIFISFAREDAAIAEAVSAILKENGYEVFTYLSNNRDPIYSTEQIAHYMKTASTHLVIDTKTARSKEGVTAEALTYAKYWSSEILKDNMDLENKIKIAAQNKNIITPSYEELVKRFKMLPEYSTLNDAEVKKDIANLYEITKNNLSGFITGLIEKETMTFTNKMNNGKESYAPYRYNSFLKNILESFFEGSPYICRLCHLPLSFPVCLPLLITRAK